MRGTTTGGWLSSEPRAFSMDLTACLSAYHQTLTPTTTTTTMSTSSNEMSSMSGSLSLTDDAAYLNVVKLHANLEEWSYLVRMEEFIMISGGGVV